MCSRKQQWRPTQEAWSLSHSNWQARLTVKLQDPLTWRKKHQQSWLLLPLLATWVGQSSHGGCELTSQWGIIIPWHKKTWECSPAPENRHWPVNSSPSPGNRFWTVNSSPHPHPQNRHWTVNSKNSQAEGHKEITHCAGFLFLTSWRFQKRLAEVQRNQNHCVQDLISPNRRLEGMLLQKPRL